MAYPQWRPAVLAHAKAAALAVDPKWTDVAVGLRNPDARSVRMYYGGECLPPTMAPEGNADTFSGRMVGERLWIAALWRLASIGTSEYEAVDDEMYAWKHELRTRLQGDTTLGGACAGLDLQYGSADIVVSGNTRYALVEHELLIAYTEYPIAQ